MYLHEEVLLLALKDDRGKIGHRAGNFQTIMAGAIVAELLLAERITISNNRRKSMRSE